MKKLLHFTYGTALALLASPAVALDRVNAFDDWSVYTADNPKECWVASAPLSVENTRGGKKVSVNRGDILVQVTWIPSQQVVGEVSFSSGYQLRNPGQDPVKMQIGSSVFELIAEGQHAWAANAEIDTQIRVAMTKGSNAVLFGTSQRSGTNTKDLFSLKGFTAALKDAKQRCGVS